MLEIDDYNFYKNVEYIRKDLQNEVVLLKLNLKYANVEIASSFKKYLFEVIDEGNIKIVIEFNNCESIDSTFLGALVLALKKIKKVNGELVIVYNNELLKSLFFVAGMQNVFKPFTDRNKAVSYLSIIKN